MRVRGTFVSRADANVPRTVKSQITGTLLHMTDSNPQPPVVVEYSISWLSRAANLLDTIEIERELWDSMTPAERNKYCEDAVEKAMEAEVQWGWIIPNAADQAQLGEPTRTTRWRR